MKDEEYASIAAALDRALEAFENQPVLFGTERELRDRLRQLREKIAVQRTHARDARDGDA